MCEILPGGYRFHMFSHHQKRHAEHTASACGQKASSNGAVFFRPRFAGGQRLWPGGQAGGVQQQTSLLLKVLIVYIDWYLYGVINFYCIYIYNIYSIYVDINGWENCSQWLLRLRRVPNAEFRRVIDGHKDWTELDWSWLIFIDLW